MGLSRPHGLKAWITSTCPHPKGHGQVEVTHPTPTPHAIKNCFLNTGTNTPPDWTAGYFPPSRGDGTKCQRGVQGNRPPLGDYIYNNKSFKRQKNGCSPILTRFVVFLLHAPPCMYTCTTVHHKPPPFMGYTVKHHVTHARTNRSYAHESTNHL